MDSLRKLITSATLLTRYIRISPIMHEQATPQKGCYKTISPLHIQFAQTETPEHIHTCYNDLKKRETTWNQQPTSTKPTSNPHLAPPSRCRPSSRNCSASTRTQSVRLTSRIRSSCLSRRNYRRRIQRRSSAHNGRTIDLTRSGA